MGRLVSVKEGTVGGRGSGMHDILAGFVVVVKRLSDKGTRRGRVWGTKK